MSGLNELMSLVNQNERFFDITLPSGKKESIKRWRVKDKKELILAVDDTNIVEETINLVASCLKDSKNIDKWSREDLLYALKEIRKISEGQELEITFDCPHCGTPNTVALDLDADIRVKKFDPTPIDIKEIDLRLIIRDMTYREKMELGEKYKTTAEYNFYYLIHSIQAIISKGETFNKLTLEEIEEFIDSLDTSIFKEIFEALKERAPYFGVYKEVKCENPKCKKDIIISFDDVEGFLI